MGLNTENADVEPLAGELAGLGHETETDATRRAFLERRARLHARGGTPAGQSGLREYLERNVWPMVPSSELGRVFTREEEDRILGYGPE